ncbi:MAG: serine hydrolase domain-containing protein [Pseudomonadota bacterium]
MRRSFFHQRRCRKDTSYSRGPSRRLNLSRALAALGAALMLTMAGPSSSDGLDGALKSLKDSLSLLDTAPNMLGLGVCVAEGTETRLLLTQGRRTLAGEPLDPHTRFRLASVSKGFAATTAVILSTQGKLDLSTQAKSLVPYFTLPDPDQVERVTLTHLLSHRLGLPPNAYDNLLEASRKPEDIVPRFAQVEPLCPAADCYGYQNVGFNLIAEAIEKTTGVAYEEQVVHRLLRPLAMEDAGFGRSHLSSDENWARPHRGRGRFLRQSKVNDNYYRVPAAAGLNASTSDLCRWLKTQLGESPEVVSPQVLEILRTPQVFTRAEMYRGKWRRTRLRSAHYGLGWRIYDYAGQQVVFHAGSVSGYGAVVAVLPDQQVGLAAVWNSESTRPWGILPAFLDAYLGLPERDWMKLDPLRLSGDPAATGAYAPEPPP